LRFGSGSVWGGTLDSDPLACAAARNWRFAAKPQGGDTRSRWIEERRAEILAIWEAREDFSLEELRLALVELGLHVSSAGLHRFFVRHGMTRKQRMARSVCKIDFEVF